MAHQGKNRAPRGAGNVGAQPWFNARKRKSRVRDRMQKASRRRNRGQR